MHTLNVEASWNEMTHAQKSDFIFRRNGRVHLNRRGRQFSRLLAAEVCASAVVMLDTPCSEIVWRVLATHCIRQFPLHFSSPCVTVCHHISNGVYSPITLWHITQAMNEDSLDKCMVTGNFCNLFFIAWQLPPPHSQCARANHFVETLVSKAVRHTTVGRTPLQVWSARRRDLYMTTENAHNRQTSIPKLRIEPSIPTD